MSHICANNSPLLYSSRQSFQPPLTSLLLSFFLSLCMCVRVCMCVCQYTRLLSLHSSHWLARFVGGEKKQPRRSRQIVLTLHSAHCSCHLVTLHLPACSQARHWPATSAGARGTAVLNSTKNLISASIRPTMREFSSRNHNGHRPILLVLSLLHLHKFKLGV